MVPIDRKPASYLDSASAEASTNANNAANTAAGAIPTTESMEEDKPAAEEKGQFYRKSPTISQH